MITLSTVQFAPIFGDKDANILKIHEVIDSLHSNIIIFPELCTTGYFFLNNDEALAASDQFDSDVIGALQRKSTQRHQIYVIGFAESDEGKVYNSAALIMPNPALTSVYRKTHLFYKERFCFSEGNTGFFVVKSDEFDISIGVMICYDWRFPESSRTLALKGADLIVCPSNLVTDVWHIAMPARALENKVYLAVANRIGTENRGGEELQFKGESGIWGYNGKIMAKSGVDEESILTVEIDPALTRNKKFNEFNDIFADRRPDKYL
ncbi:MAG: carbon-nitrogen hydrolase [Ignavibacteria bacterium]|nr:carbon-nitrogen hydrolase [Ignavibacteria bacterium]